MSTVLVYSLTHLTLRIDIFTLFPAMFTGPLTESILARAQDAGLLHIALVSSANVSVPRSPSVATRRSTRNSTWPIRRCTAGCRRNSKSC